MKTIQKKRAYHMSERAEKVARNDRRIMDAMAEMWLEVPLSELTLDKVARRSGVTVRTILRKFGSKEGLLKACVEIEGERYTRKRMQVTPGDLPGILDALLEEYERMGDALIRTLTVEYDFPSTQELLKKARTIHREWCASVFNPYLPPTSSEKYEIVLSAYIAATEFYLWKLLRRDLGKSLKQCRQIFLFSLESLAAKAKNQK
ncbi:MAG: TetR/AcrR family transcriptional regulator [Bacteroidales bacterium]